MISLDVKPLYPAKVASKPFLVEFVAPQFQKLDGKRGDTREHVVHFLDYIGAHSNDQNLCLRELSKSITLCIYMVHEPQVMIRPKLSIWSPLFNTKFFCAEPNFIELGKSRQYPEEDLDACIKHFYEKALHCCDPVIEDVLVNV